MIIQYSTSSSTFLSDFPFNHTRMIVFGFNSLTLFRNLLVNIGTHSPRFRGSSLDRASTMITTYWQNDISHYIWPGFFHPSALYLPLSLFKLSAEAPAWLANWVCEAHLKFLIGISNPPHVPTRYRETNRRKTPFILLLATAEGT